MKTSDNLEEFADELTLLKKGVHEENFQVYSNPLFEFNDNFTSSNENPLFNEMDEDVVNENSNISYSDEPVLLNTPLSDKVECFAPEDDIDEIDAFLAMEVSSNFEEGYFDISTSRSQENVHANPSSIIESLPVSLIPVEDSDPVQEEIDIFLVPDDKFTSMSIPSHLSFGLFSICSPTAEDFLYSLGPRLGLTLPPQESPDSAGPALLRTSEKRSTILSPSVPQEAPLMDPYNA
ncbi:hypothetical protein Tco_0226135 [Tanacetum coccineum]